MTVSRMAAGRLAFAAPGLALGGFGVYRLLTQVPNDDLLAIGEWLLGALILHDAIFSPAVVGIGMLLSYLPGRARGFVQGGLVAGGLVTVVAIPLIYRRGSQPRQKAILEQNYGANLMTLLAIIAAATVALYAVRVVRDRRRTEADEPT